MMELDFAGILLEEIALEGLDGITLSTLWIRLKENPQFGITVDDKSKPFLWRNIKMLGEVEFYELKEPRPPLVLFDRFDYIDPETGLILEMETVPEDIYPVQIIKEKDILGSCSTYYTRENITEEVRGASSLSLQQVVERWGERFLIVASQQARWHALMGTEFDPSYQWVELTYCILERIGRGRYMGELSRGKLSLSVFNEAPKTLFYHTKKLSKQTVSIIRKQTVCSKDLQNRQVQCRIFHLTRFYKEIRSKYTVLREQLCDYLYKKSNHRELLPTARSDLNIEEKSFKKLYQNACRYVKVYQTYYRNIYPNAEPEKYMNKNKVTERQLKIIELIKLPSKGGSDSENDEDDEDDDADEADEDITEYSAPKAVVYERPLLYQVIKTLEAAGPKGITLQCVKKIFLLDILESRLLVKYLVKMGVASMLMIDVGRQKKSIYISKKFEAESDFHQEVQIEKKKMKALSFAAEDGMENSAVEDVSTVNLSQSALSQDGEADVPPDKVVLETTADQTANIDDHKSDLDHSETTELLSHVTGRFLKRANWIFEAVREAKLIDNAFVLVKLIRGKEKAEGIEFQVDKKSILRIVRKLVKEGKIHLINTVIKVEKYEKQLSFVCDPSIQSTDQIVRSAIDQARHKLISVRREHIRDAKKGSLNTTVPEHPGIPETAQQSIERLQGYKSKLTASQMVFDRKASRSYGLLQKMMKIQVVHRYLWYLCYDYGKETVGSSDSTDHGLQIDSRSKANQSTDVSASETPKRKSRKRKASGTVKKEQSSTAKDVRCEAPIDWLKELQEPTIHVDQMNWKRYLPELPEHKGFTTGWCLISDVLLSLPVVIFCQVITINYKIPGLKEILADPVRRFYPITHLPLFLTQQLLYARKYIFGFYDLCVRLCQMGLLSFGTQVNKDKDQMFIFIHKKASLVDTRTSLPAYSKTVSPPNEGFVHHSYVFNSERDIDNYWIDLKLFSLNTFLNTKRSGPDTEEPNDEQDKSTCELTMELAMSPKDPSTVKDLGKIPGDGRGSAGMDSELYCHLLRNWTPGTGVPNYCRKTASLSTLPEPSVEEGEEAADRNEQQPERSFPKISAHQRVPRMMPKERLTLLGSKGKLPEVVKVIVKKNAKGNKGGKGIKRKLVEKIIAKKDKKRKLKMPKSKKPKNLKLPWSDERDKYILDNQELMRVIWTPKEDSILLVCQVASLVMDKKRKGIVVPWTVVRDVLEKHCLNPKCPKTSKACQRRVRFALLNSQTRQNVSLFLEEALHDEDISGKFRDKQIKFTDYVQNHKDYIELVEKLMVKFSSVDMSRNILPNTLSELQTEYNMTTVGQLHNIRRYNDVETKREICYNVLQNILHSYLSLDDKQGRSFEMYKLLSQYPDDLLLDVMKGMRMDGTVTKIKNDNRNMNVPAGTIMHDMKLTQKYDYIFRSRFPTSLFDDCRTFVSSVCENFVTSNKPMVLDDMEGGHCATLIAITQLRKVQYTVEVPEEIITLDAENMYLFPYGRGKVTLPMLMAFEKKQQIKLKESIQKSIESSSTAPAAGTSSETSVPSPVTSVCSSSEIHFGFKTGAGVLETESGRIKATHASRSLLCLLRTQSLGAKDLKAYNMQDNFVINTCPVSMAMTDNEEKVADWLPLKEEIIKSVLDKQRTLLPFQLDLDELWPKMKKAEGLTQRELNFAKVLYKNIESHKELGIKKYQLQTFKKESGIFTKTLAALLHHSAIVKVGMTCARFVALLHARPWLTHSYKNTRGRSKPLDQIEEDITPLSNLENDQSKGDNSDCNLQVQTPTEKPGKRKSSQIIGDDAEPSVKLVKGQERAKNVSETSSQFKPQQHSMDTDLEIESTSDAKKTEQKSSDGSQTVSSESSDSVKTESADSVKTLGKRKPQAIKRKRSDSDIFVSSEEEKKHDESVEHAKTANTDSAVNQSSSVPAPVSTYEKVRFVSRPWRKPEGLINKPILKMMLESVMLWVMMNPGSTADDICKRYVPYLQPIMVNDILEILEDLGCVTKTFLRNEKKPTLFSKPKAATTVLHCREGDTTVYDTTVEAVFRMGQFSSHLT